MKPDRYNSAIAGAVFVCTAVALWWLVGQRLFLTNDEGIYFDGARRILAGQAPYRDFFTYIGPGAFWNTAAAFRAFGVTLGAAHALLVAEFSLIAACLWWMTAQLESRVAGLGLAVFYVAEMASLPDMLTVNHRLDSAALSAAAGTALMYGARSGARWAWAVAGGLAAYAAWTTPSMILVLAPMLGWAAYERRWTGAGLFTAGAAGVSAAVAGVLAAQGALIPMVRAMLWASANYAGPNRFAYGSVLGGYGMLFRDVHGVAVVGTGLAVVLLVVPALVPIFAAAGLAIFLKQPNDPRVWWLAACAAGGVASGAPRMDIPHLAYGGAFALVIVVCALMRLPFHTRARILVALGAVAVVMVYAAVMQRAGLEKIESRVGTLYGDHYTLRLVRELERTVAPGESFFSFPYAPLAYFLTQGANPTRYSYLQPGMMTDQQEETALAELRIAPPRKVLYFDLNPEEVLRVCPTTDPKRLRFKKIEGWLSENYTPDEQLSRANLGYQLLVPNKAGGH